MVWEIQSTIDEALLTLLTDTWAAILLAQAEKLHAQYLRQQVQGWMQRPRAEACDSWTPKKSGSYPTGPPGQQHKCIS